MTMAEQATVGLRMNVNETEMNQIRDQIQERTQDYTQEAENLTQKIKNVYTHQNKVRVAVHAMLAIGNFSGGAMGQNVSGIAREFNNSVQATIRAEERIQERSGLVRFFVGGDEKSAAEIEQEVDMNRERIQQLKQIRDSNEGEIRSLLTEHIQNMEQEQDRLMELAQNEKQEKGIFGWLFK